MDMDKKIKNYLNISIIGSLILFALTAIYVANSYSHLANSSSYRNFSASAEAKVTAIPDVAQFSFSVLTEGGKDVAVLQRENSEKANRALGVIKASGVADEDIATSNYNIQPRYQYYNCQINSKEKTKKCPPPEIVGYSINQTVNVKVRDFEMTSKILSEVVNSGVNSISDLSFIIDDRTALENEARNLAIAKASAKAEGMAKAGGFKIGRLVSIYEGGGFYPRNTFEKSSAMGMGGDVSITPQIEPGSQEISINVTLTYEIK